jgi:general L-amino acid transport system permease protein
MADALTYVRREMLPAREAPRSISGPVAWARENLFSGWLNSILTILSLAAVWWLVSHIWPWFAHSVWNATSLQECRRIIAETWGEGASGACLAVIRERWKQFLFGFYPADLYWRPTLAFVLLFVALAPVLFSDLPRRLLWFSVVFPGVAYWLLWGGSLGVPLVAYAGFAVGGLVYRLVRPLSIGPVALAAAVLATIVWWLYLAEPVARALPVLALTAFAVGYVVQRLVRRVAIAPVALTVAIVAAAAWWLLVAGPLDRWVPQLSLTPVASKQFGGFTLSIVIGVTGIAFSLPLGILLALGRRSKMMIVKALSVGFIEFIRGVPLITLLLVASFLLNIFLPPGTNFDIILRVIIMVTLFSAAYMAETIRGGLAALPRGQYEAADALGLDYWKSMRLIIMPQALKISIPNIVNNFIGLFKDTTLVAIIALLDPIGLITSIRADSNWNGIVWELYGFVGLIFFLCCYGMGAYSKYLERKLRTDHR